MGTRSLTRVHEVGSPPENKQTTLVCIYRQMDGYPSGHGADLAEFLKGRTVGNGIALGKDTTQYSNGPGCFAAGLVHHLKKENDNPAKPRCGSIYLYPVGTNDVGEEYEYDIMVPWGGGEIAVRCTNTWEKKVLFDGSADDFVEFVENHES